MEWPENKNRRTWTDEEKEQFITNIEAMLFMKHKIVEVKIESGLDDKTLSDLVREIKQRWKQPLRQKDIHQKRNELLFEIQRIRDFIWDEMPSATRPTDKLKFLSAILECNKRTSSLLYLEKMESNQEGEEEKQLDDLTSSFDNVDEAILTQIGDLLAKQPKADK